MRAALPARLVFSCRCMDKTTHIERGLLQRRVRALLIVVALLLPTVCAFGTLTFMLAAQQPGAVLLLALTILASLLVFLVVIAVRLLRTFRALNEIGD